LFRTRLRTRRSVTPRSRRVTLLTARAFVGTGALYQTPHGGGSARVAARIAALSEQLLSGLAHCHARGVLHLDIRPETLVVTPPRRLAPSAAAAAPSNNQTTSDGGGDGGGEPPPLDAEGNPVREPPPEAPPKLKIGDFHLASQGAVSARAAAPLPDRAADAARGAARAVARRRADERVASVARDAANAHESAYRMNDGAVPQLNAEAALFAARAEWVRLAALADAGGAAGGAASSLPPPPPPPAPPRELGEPPCPVATDVARMGDRPDVGEALAAPLRGFTPKVRAPRSMRIIRLGYYSARGPSVGRPERVRLERRVVLSLVVSFGGHATRSAPRRAPHAAHPLNSPPQLVPRRTITTARNGASPRDAAPPPTPIGAAPTPMTDRDGTYISTIATRPAGSTRARRRRSRSAC